MDITKKQSFAQTAIQSISTHFDETKEAVYEKLDQLTAFIKQEKEAFEARQATYIAAAKAKIDALVAARAAQPPAEAAPAK